LIKEISQEHSVIFSSHILAEIQATCQDIIMIEGGKIVFADPMDSFNNYIEPNSLVINMENPPSRDELLAISGITGVEFITSKTARMHFDAIPYISEFIIKASVAKGWRLQEITLEKSSLDAIFAQLSNNKPNPSIKS
ncbi:MAG: transporter related, partial [Mucilaginibacter sp.]|nr:transporter related [Mucilaginibacter sp.]